MDIDTFCYRSEFVKVGFFTPTQPKKDMTKPIGTGAKSLCEENRADCVVPATSAGPSPQGHEHSESLCHGSVAQTPHDLLLMS